MGNTNARTMFQNSKGRTIVMSQPLWKNDKVKIKDISLVYSRSKQCVEYKVTFWVNCCAGFQTKTISPPNLGQTLHVGCRQCISVLETFTFNTAFIQKAFREGRKTDKYDKYVEEALATQTEEAFRKLLPVTYRKTNYESFTNNV
jgi:hypothetical protein